MLCAAVRDVAHALDVFGAGSDDIRLSAGLLRQASYTTTRLGVYNTLLDIATKSVVLLFLIVHFSTEMAKRVFLSLRRL